MKASLLLQELEQLADRLGWEIRYELGDFRSGFCQQQDRKLIIIQKKTSPTERVDFIAKTLAEEDLDGMFLLPQVRKVIDSQRGNHD
jgi:hypothetical protein